MGNDYVTVIMQDEPVHEVLTWTVEGDALTKCQMLLGRDLGGLISSPNGKIVRNNKEVRACEKCKSPDPEFLERIAQMERESR